MVSDIGSQRPVIIVNGKAGKGKTGKSVAVPDKYSAYNYVAPMMRCSIRVLIILLGAVAVAPSVRSQDDLTARPMDVTISNLRQNPRTFNGRLVRVWGVPAIGWEGDDVLREWPQPKKGVRRELWFYPKTGQDKEIFGLPEPLSVQSKSALFVFTGIFHFVPERSRGRQVFDPGPYQLEVTSARPWAVATSTGHPVE
ncbi:MAG TPA: hypothetical protein VFU86_15205 [Terriglobales bacterium]|nr:hypothetical protein [Terriglobales bacterium]